MTKRSDFVTVQLMHDNWGMAERFLQKNACPGNPCYIHRFEKSTIAQYVPKPEQR
jgi:hypothetical protein